MTNEDLENAVKRLAGQLEMLTRITSNALFWSRTPKNQTELPEALRSIHSRLVDDSSEDSDLDPRFLDGQLKTLQTIQEEIAGHLAIRDAD